MEGKRPENQILLGPTLRQAREQRGLSIDDVAQSLRLSARIVAALEEDAFERLPGPTYVRGYLRNYAQFLNLAPQPLIDAYGKLPQATQRTDMTAPAPVRQITSSDMVVRLGTVVVAAVVFGLAGLWWIGHDATGVSSRTSASPPAAVDESPPVAPQARAVPESDRPAPAPAPGPGENPESVATETGNPAAATPATNPPELEEKATATAPPPDPNVPLSHLVLFVHEDSWADVRDAQQRRLLYETIPAGRVVTVDGVAPLSVFLGNVEGVTVEFNGEPYDAMRHRRGQVARFTLGPPPG